MTDTTIDTAAAADRAARLAAQEARVRGRYRSEARFRVYGILALAVTTLFLAVLLGKIIVEGIPGFTAHSLAVDLPLAAADIDPKGSKDLAEIRKADYRQDRPRLPCEELSGGHRPQPEEAAERPPQWRRRRRTARPRGCRSGQDRLDPEGAAAARLQHRPVPEGPAARQKRHSQRAVSALPRRRPATSSSTLRRTTSPT